MGIRISEMEAAAQMSADDIVPIVSNGENKIVTGEKIKQYAAGDKQDSLMGGNISSGDVNNYTTAGNYYVSSANVTNIPISTTGMLEVVTKQTTSGGAAVQRFTAINSNAVVGVYERCFISGAWRAWREISLINTPVLSTFDSVAVASGAHVTLGSITPPAGTYLINAGASFPNNDTGIRRIILSRAGTSTATPVLVDSDRSLHEITVPAAALNSSYTQSVQLTTIATVNATYPSIYMRAYQNSGSELTVNGAIQYMRIM